MKSKKEEKKNKKKKGHPIRNTLIVALLLGLLTGGGLWRFGGYDWGYQGGSSNETSTSAEEQSSVEATTAETVTETVTESVTETQSTAEDTGEKVIVIEVAGDQVNVNGKSFDKSEAENIKKEILSVYEDGKNIELIDNKSVKAAYDVVKSILDESGYKYKESTK